MAGVALLAALTPAGGGASQDLSGESVKRCILERFSTVMAYNQPRPGAPGWRHSVFCATVAHDLAWNWVLEHNPEVAAQAPTIPGDRTVILTEAREGTSDAGR